MLILSTTPSKADGTSTLDLSLSKVITGSFLEILSPSFTRISIISTSSKSPISGTSNFSLISLFVYIYIIYF